MPKREVRPVKILHHGKWRWRVFVPRILTGGKRKTKWFSTEKAARDFCREVEGNRRMARTGIEVLSHEDRIRIMVALRKLGMSVDELTAAVDAHLLKRINTEKTFAQVAQECLDAKKAANWTAKYVSSLANTFRRFCETFGSRQPNTVTASEIREWLSSHDWEPITRQSYLKDVRNLYAFAVAHHYCHENVAKAVQRPKAPRKPPGILSVEALERLLRAVEGSDTPLIPRLVLVAFGGLRPDEAKRTLPQHVRKDYIDLPPDKTKNAARRLIKMTPTLKAWLKVYPVRKPVPNYRKRFNAIRESIKPPIALPHDVLRHSFCSYAVPVHGIKETSLMADHSEDVLKRHYLEQVTLEDAESFWELRPVSV